jgi:dynein heavy chain
VIFGSIFGGFLDNFADEIKAFGKPIVNASVELYHRMAQELLPTPDKSHYTFNLRDLSKLFQGVSNQNQYLMLIILPQNSYCKLGM